MSEDLDTTAVKPVFTDSIVHIVLITDVIFAFCSPATLIRLSMTCRSAYTAVKMFIPSEFNINRLLKRFFPDPLAFRSLQARTATLISGSIALQFFSKQLFPSSDLDLYVYMRHRREVGRWLMSIGYECIIPQSSMHSSFERMVADPDAMDQGEVYRIPGVACVFTFAKRRRNGPELRVQVIVAQETGSMAVILGFHSTCVMNVISYEKAYCLFPLATLEEKQSLVSSSFLGRNRQRLEGVTKYASRGYKMIQRLSPDVPHHSSWRFGTRWIDDGGSWVIPLDTTGVEPPPPVNMSTPGMTHDPVALTNWLVDWSEKGVLLMVFKPLRSPLLRFAYVLSDEWVTDALEGVLKGKETLDERRRILQLEDTTYCDGELLALCRDIRG